MKHARGSRSTSSVGRRARTGLPQWYTQQRCGIEVLEARQLLTADPLAPVTSDEVLDYLSAASIAAMPLAQPTVHILSDEPVAGALLSGSVNPSGYTPAQLRHAYGVDQVFFGNGTIQGDGTGQTIAIITAYHAPTAAADLAAFSTYFGLQQFGTPGGPTFTQVAQDGSTNYPITDPAGPGNNNFELETALDVQWAHAMAPGANILLVEANSPSFSDLVLGAVDYARNQPGVVAISMSFGAGEFSTEVNYDPYFTTPSNHAGVAYIAASGDGGSPGVYPGYSPNVLSIGGTTLSLNGSNNITSETGWSGSGGGISVYEAQPSYQIGVVTQSSTKRTLPDVAFVGNQSTGVPVYDSYNFGTSSPWIRVGGTSLGSPAWAGLVAVADQGRTVAGLPVMDSPELLSKIYSMPASNFNDITSGSNGSFTAAAGYDLVTGRGSPKANLVIPSLVGVGTVSGRVYNDANTNGVWDVGDTGLSGWTVYQDLNGNGTFDPVVNSTFNSTDVPKSIPDNNLTGITSNNVVSGLSGDIIDINVKITTLSHTRPSDLTITLISPTGVRVPLFVRNGTSGSNLTNTVFDATAPVSITVATAPFTGSFRPTGDLTSLVGADPNGTWKLEVVDSVFSRSGTLSAWSLQLTTGDPNTTSAADGTYAWSNLLPGNYTIREVLQAPYVQTGPAGGVYNVGVTAGSTSSSQNFGNVILPSATPGTVTLLAGSDTGSSNSDNITRLNNSSPATALQFQVTGTIAGATVTLLADGNVIGSATASGTTTTVTTDGVQTLSDGFHVFTARQTEPGKPTSALSSQTNVKIDTTAATASITAVASPRLTPVTQMTITFSEAVSGLDLSDLQLTVDGGANLLTGSQSVSSGDGVTWVLSNLAGLTALPGLYQLTLNPIGTPIVDIAGNVVTASTQSSFTVGSQVVARQLFYNNSRYDGNNAAVNAADDNAIASDKTAYTGSGAATFGSVSSFSRGINGLMVDIVGSHPGITAADLSFRVGNNNSPGSWSAAPDPTVVTVRGGAGIGGADRITILWADNAIQQTWLQVTVAANAQTGLITPDVFYFGSAIGDTGEGESTTFITNVFDENSARNNPASVLSNIPVTNLYDFNRDGRVDSSDQSLTRIFLNTQLTALKAINLSGSSAPQAAPQTSTANQSGSAAATSLSQGTTTAGSPSANLLRALHTDIVLALAARDHGADGHRSGTGIVWSVDEPLIQMLARNLRSAIARKK